ncbi:glycosyltransferase 87 family protein [Nocardia sp. BMG111209]|uniref:glycosyltransferase 87 family protein n=1 Tax=Nocardia sp. BMG111209 TaxID=1160137 RepID=UPI0003622BFF|nr:glycosyltransferase 87 family protein [Nocardia sp. BMG111209]
MSSRPAAGVTARTVRRGLPVTAVLLCAVTLLFAYLNKARCVGAPFTADGRSLRFDRIKDSAVCYSDIQYLWLGRDIDLHVFPYIHGDITPDGTLIGGAVEYPVLSGLFMWLGAAGAGNDAEFLLHSALLLAPFALLTAWMLGRLSGSAAFLWAAGPPLVLYAFHNWELPVVATAVGAVYVLATLTRYSLRTRGIIAAVLLGIGFCLKLYPGIFVLPLLAYVLTGGEEDDRAARRRYDVGSAVAVVLAAVTTVVLINLPFALAGYRGWRASILFQQIRQADITTNSVWYWGIRPMFGDLPGSEQSFQDLVAVASPVLVMLSFVLAMWLGWRRFQTSGVFPWVGVSGAMLCGFLLFHKVHSPQYTLWLLPFVILLDVPWTAIGLYLVADLAIGIGVFRYFYTLGTTGVADIEENIVQFGVWGRAILLVYFFFAFARARARRDESEPIAAGRPADELVPVGR